MEKTKNQFKLVESLKGFSGSHYKDLVANSKDNYYPAANADQLILNMHESHEAMKSDFKKTLEELATSRTLLQFYQEQLGKALRKIEKFEDRDNF